MSHRNEQVASILAQLKEYSFENNADFKDNIIDGFIVAKTYLHTDPRLLGSRDDDFKRDIQSTIYRFSAYRQPMHVRGRAAYIYHLGVTVTRAFERLEPYIAMQLSEDTVDELQDIEHGELTESFRIEFEASDLTPDRIDSVSSYQVDLYGDTIHDTDESSFSFTRGRTVVSIPNGQAETKEFSIPAAIEQEQIPSEADRFINDLTFSAIVGPHWEKQNQQSLPTEDAARRMAIILSKMRTGKLESS